MSKQVVARIIESIGSERLQASLGVTGHSIRAAKVAGRFPASWYAVVSDLCRTAGIECSIDLFRWKEGIGAAVLAGDAA